MIEVGGLPGGFGMAGSAVGGEPGSLMVRVGGGIVVALMAADAGGWRAGISVGMASFTRDRSMRSRQWEIGFIVVKVGNRVQADSV